MKLTDKVHVVTALAPDSDALSGTKATDIISLKDYDSALFILTIGVGATGTTAITVAASDDASGTTTEDIAFTYRRVEDTTSSDIPGDRTTATASGFTTTAGSNQKYLIEVQSQDLPEGKPFVKLDLVEAVDSPVDAGIEVLLMGARYSGDTKTTAIA